MTTSNDLDSATRQRIDAAVVDYITREQHWPRDAYRIEPRRRSPDGKTLVVDVIHRDDTVPGPGGGSGKSLQLHLDATTFAVQQVLHFQ